MYFGNISNPSKCRAGTALVRPLLRTEGLRVVRFQLCAAIPMHYRRGWAALSATKHLSWVDFPALGLFHSGTQIGKE